MKTLWTIVLLACCVCRGESTKPTVWAGEGAKRFLHVWVGGVFSSYCFFTLADEKFLFEQFDPVRPHAHETRLTVRNSLSLSRSEVTDIWAKIDALQIDRWNPRYSPKDLGVEVFDGTVWQVALRIDGKEKRSSGDNVYPAVLPVGQPILLVDERGKVIRTAFHGLLELLEGISKKANKAPEPTPGSVTLRARSR